MAKVSEIVSIYIMEDTRHFKYTDKMEFHVIELPKLPRELKEDSSRMELWAKFINAEKTEEFDMIAEIRKKGESLNYEQFFDETENRFRI